MVRINFFILESHQELLKELSEETGAPYSELIRRAIQEYLERAGKPVKDEK